MAAQTDARVAAWKGCTGRLLLLAEACATECLPDCLMQFLELGTTTRYVSEVMCVCGNEASKHNNVPAVTLCTSTRPRNQRSRSNVGSCKVLTVTAGTNITAESGHPQFCHPTVTSPPSKTLRLHLKVVARHTSTSFASVATRLVRSQAPHSATRRTKKTPGWQSRAHPDHGQAWELMGRRTQY